MFALKMNMFNLLMFSMREMLVKSVPLDRDVYGDGHLCTEGLYHASFLCAEVCMMMVFCVKTFLP